MTTDESGTLGAQLAPEDERQDPDEPSRRASAGTVLRVGALLLAVVAVLGVLTGVVWSRLAPDVLINVTDQGAFLGELQGARMFGVDGWFVVVTAVAGLLSGAYAWWRHRDDPVLLVIGVIVAGGVGAVLSWRLGILLGPDPLEQTVRAAKPGTSVVQPLALESKAGLVVWPLVSTAVVLALTLLEPRPRHTAGHARV